MVEERLIVEPEVEEIFTHIQNGDNFLLSGGAGSGKTYSLVHVIKKAIEENPTAKIACITYTNAAVKEIEHRVNHNNLSVSTIHDFLWDCIKSFQNEIKLALIALINDEDVVDISTTEGKVGDDFFSEIKNGIQYKEWFNIKEGIISHDELIILSEYMFKKHSKLSDILKDKYKFILIDEYQDTDEKVVKILLEHLQKSNRTNTIGFFGDAMQAIYEDGIGDLDYYKSDEINLVKEVQKRANRRNPKAVIDLANIIRTDGLQQKPSEDKSAPNMHDGNVKLGNVQFVYSHTKSLDDIKQHSIFSKWNFKDSKNTKELNLTHNLIAPKAGFKKLIEIYDKDPILKLKDVLKEKIKEQNLTIDDNATFDDVVKLVNPRGRNPLDNRLRPKLDIINDDPLQKKLYSQLKDLPYMVVRKMYLSKEALIDDKKQDEHDENKKGSKRDYLVKHLFKIQSLLHFYETKQFNEFIRRTELKVLKVSDKIKIKEIIDTLKGMSSNTIEEVIEYAADKLICRKDDNFNKFVQSNDYLYNRVKEVEFKEFQNLFYYLEGFTPFSTQHKIKGAEFENVLVVLDNGGWNSLYNFKNLFTLEGSESILKQTQKIFYVCCTRAKENLIVYYDSPNDKVIAKAKEWFGKDNTVEII